MTEPGTPPKPPRPARRRRWIKPVVWIACLAPLGILAYDGLLGGGLGANPIAEILDRLGFWTLVLLTATLACTPARIVFGWSWPVRVRRTIGVFTFVYAVLHFTTYFAIDQLFDLRAIWADIVKRKFITLGFLALVMLIPLALTSNNASVRRLGYVRWKRLHRLTYLVAVLGLIHFYWRVKADHREPWIFIIVVGLLMLVRGIGRLRDRARASGRTA